MIFTLLLSFLFGGVSSVNAQQLAQAQPTPPRVIVLAGQGHLELRLEGIEVDPMELSQLEMDLLVDILMADWVMSEDQVRLELEGEALERIQSKAAQGEAWREPLRDLILAEARARQGYRDWTTWESWTQWEEFKERMHWDEEDFFSNFSRIYEEWESLLKDQFDLPDWPWSALRTVWTFFVVWLVALLARLFAPRASRLVGLRLRRQWIRLLWWGLLGWILALGLLVLLVASLVGILLLPFYFVAAFILYYLSWAHAASAIGRLIWRSSSPLSTLPLLTGLPILVAMTLVPYGGFVVGVILWLAFGAISRQMLSTSS